MPNAYPALQGELLNSPLPSSSSIFLPRSVPVGETRLCPPPRTSTPRLHHLEIFKRGISTAAKPGFPHRSGMDIEQGDVVPGIDNQLVIDFAGTGDVLAAGLPSHFSAAR